MTIPSSLARPGEFIDMGFSKVNSVLDGRIVEFQAVRGLKSVKPHWVLRSFRQPPIRSDNAPPPRRRNRLVIWLLEHLSDARRWPCLIKGS